MKITSKYGIVHKVFAQDNFQRVKDTIDMTVLH